MSEQNYNSRHKRMEKMYKFEEHKVITENTQAGERKRVMIH